MLRYIAFPLVERGLKDWSDDEIMAYAKIKAATLRCNVKAAFGVVGQKNGGEMVSHFGWLSGWQRTPN